MAYEPFLLGVGVVLNILMQGVDQLVVAVLVF